MVPVYISLRIWSRVCSLQLTCQSTHSKGTEKNQDRNQRSGAAQNSELVVIGISMRAGDVKNGLQKDQRLHLR
jgi:hypothetical protein